MAVNSLRLLYKQGIAHGECGGAMLAPGSDEEAE